MFISGCGLLKLRMWSKMASTLQYVIRDKVTPEITHRTEIFLAE